MTAPKDEIGRILEKDYFDFISTDSQHSPLSEERLAQFCDYANDFGIPVNLRIKNTHHTYLIGNRRWDTTFVNQIGYIFKQRYERSS